MNKIATTFVATGLMSMAANAQSLGSAANYDILVTNNGKLELTDSNQLFGQVGVSNNAEFKGKDVQNFDGTVFVHSGAAKFEADNLNPSGGVQRSSAIDTKLNKANADFNSYASYLSGLSSNVTVGKQETTYTFNTTMPLTVIDFEEIKLEGDDKSVDTFNLIGRAGFNDQVIIRSKKTSFDGGVVNLVNLDSRDVVWFNNGGNEFDLHKGDSIFSGIIVSPEQQVTLGEVNFTGAVYGADLKLGSGFSFNGNTIIPIPEPSSGLMVLLGAAGMLAVRRRNR